MTTSGQLYLDALRNKSPTVKSTLRLLEELKNRNTSKRILQHKKLLDVFAGRIQNVKKLTKEAAYVAPKDASDLRIDLGPGRKFKYFVSFNYVYDKSTNTII